ncbi:MAG: flagellar hook-associated protein FlgL [Acidobacteriota bacterium]
MRISENSMVQDFLRNLENTRQRWLRYNQEISTGKRLHRPSDNPAESARVLRIRDEVSRANQYFRNITAARARLGATDSALNTLRNSILSIADRVAFALNGTTDEQGRRAIAGDLRGTLDALYQTASTTVDGYYIFSGSLIDTAPLVVSGGSYSYQGDDLALEIEVMDGEAVRTNVSGREVFAEPASDLLNSLAALIEQLESGDLEAARGPLQKVQDAGRVIDTARFKVGHSIKRLENAQFRLEDRLFQLTSEISGLEDANLAESISRMVQAETALRAAVGAGSRLRQPNLFDMLG